MSCKMLWLPWIPLLLGLQAAAAPLDCSSANATVTARLRHSDILRTWQPDGDCLRWESAERSSETDQLPAAVRSGPRWLVMQLRRPMMLDRVSVLGWDGQWRAAAPVGSPVSALGAASLPLELQLEDPCRASWEAFSSSGQWRQISGQTDEAVSSVSFIRLLSADGSLSWQAINVTGQSPLMELNVSETKLLLSSDYGWVLQGWGQYKLEFCIDCCCSLQPECRLTDPAGKVLADASHLGSARISAGAHTHKLELPVLESDHNQLLQCGFDRRGPKRLELLLLLEFKATALPLSFLTALVIGHAARLSVSSDSIPDVRHRCWISAQGSRRNLTLTERAVSKAVDGQSRTLIRVRSGFKFHVSEADRNAEIKCSGVVLDSAISISEISEPCQTVIDLGSSRHWMVGEKRLVAVTSRNCSIWNVSHSCSLLTDEAGPQPLLKLQQDAFSSAHELQVSEAMAKAGWRVRCSVQQSGVAHQDSETEAGGVPAVFGRSDRAAVDDLSWVGSQLTVELRVRVSTGRLPVSSVSCSSGDEGNAASLNRTGSSHWRGELSWELGFPPRQVCCSARQDFAGEVVFESRRCQDISQLRGEVHSETHSAFASDTWTGVWVPMPVLISASALVLTALLLVAAVTWKVARARARRPLRVRCVPGAVGGVAVPLRPLHPGVGRTVSAGSSEYDYPVTEAAAPDCSVYSEAEERNTTSSGYQRVACLRRQ